MAEVSIGYKANDGGTWQPTNRLSFTAPTDMLVDARKAAVSQARALNPSVNLDKIFRRSEILDGGRSQTWLLYHDWLNDTKIHPNMKRSGLAAANLLLYNLVKRGDKSGLQDEENLRLRSYKEHGLKKQFSIQADIRWPEELDETAIKKRVAHYAGPIAHQLGVFNDSVDVGRSMVKTAQAIQLNGSFNMSIDGRSSLKTNFGFRPGQSIYQLQGREMLPGAQPIVYLAAAVAIANAGSLGLPGEFAHGQHTRA
jgi:hypothetical protein